MNRIEAIKCCKCGKRCHGEEKVVTINGLKYFLCYFCYKKFTEFTKDLKEGQPVIEPGKFIEQDYFEKWKEYEFSPRWIQRTGISTDTVTYSGIQYNHGENCSDCR